MLFHKNTKKALNWVTGVIGALVILSMILLYALPMFR
jgi:uncharacterized membrane protein YdcZ (DUF606 family)